MTDRETALTYAPIVHFDHAETIPLRAVGYSVVRKSGQSPSFRRELALPEDAAFIVEYAYYWDYDIQHMYDLEHIWVTVGRDGAVMSAQASFHGRFFMLWSPGLPMARPLDGTHVHADCQPGKHAFLPDGQLFQLMCGWRESCLADAGGGVLVGWPFAGVYAPTERENELSEQYIRKRLTFEPTLRFDRSAPDNVPFMPWEEMYQAIPVWLRAELDRLEAMEDKA